VSVQDFVGQDGHLELDSLRDAQPMKAGQRVRDVIGSPQPHSLASLLVVQQVKVLTLFVPAF